MQATLISDDREVMWRALDAAVAAGSLPANLRDSVELQITPPSLLVRDHFKEAQVERIAHEAGILSAQTWSQRLGLDYDQEQKNFAMHVGQQLPPRSQAPPGNAIRRRSASRAATQSHPEGTRIARDEAEPRHE